MFRCGGTGVAACVEAMQQLLRWEGLAAGAAGASQHRRWRQNPALPQAAMVRHLHWLPGCAHRTAYAIQRSGCPNGACISAAALACCTWGTSDSGSSLSEAQARGRSHSSEDGDAACSSPPHRTTA